MKIVWLVTSWSSGQDNNISQNLGEYPSTIPFLKYMPLKITVNICPQIYILTDGLISSTGCHFNIVNIFMYNLNVCAISFFLTWRYGDVCIPVFREQKDYSLIFWQNNILHWALPNPAKEKFNMTFFFKGRKRSSILSPQPIC